MEISVLEAGNYFKGLLLLIRQDHKITEKETSMMLRIGRTLGLEKEFCEEAIRDILENRYITNVPPKFSTHELARKFVKDGLRIAFTPGGVKEPEDRWLSAIVEANGIDSGWYNTEKSNLVPAENDQPFEADGLRVRYRG